MPKVAEDICNAFAIVPENYIQIGSYRPNLTLRFSPSTGPRFQMAANCRDGPGRADVEFFTVYLYLIRCGKGGLWIFVNPYQGTVGAIGDY